jgi:hypothetical protein
VQDAGDHPDGPNQQADQGGSADSYQEIPSKRPAGGRISLAIAAQP